MSTRPFHFLTLSTRRPTRFAWYLLVLTVLLFVSQAAASPPSPPAELTWEQFRDQLQLTDASSLEETPLGKTGGYAVDLVWTLVAAILVFWMQAGFALLEAGFTRAKNVVNILMKNILDLSAGSLAFWAIGFGLMFGETQGLFGTTHFFLHAADEGSFAFTLLIFQTVFAATAATIVSGALAERTSFVSYLIYSILMTALIYPIFGSWVWGSLFQGHGWLEAPPGGLLERWGLPGFIDFAGSTVVHSIGGWAACAGALVVGPRLGKYQEGAAPLRGHSMPLATLGMFILWMGWFGFNAGSTLGLTGSPDPYAGSGKAAGLILLNTHLSACAGVVGAMLLTWLRLGKPEIGMTLNGALAGLVSITAGCASVSPFSAIVIGFCGGLLVVWSVDFFERIQIDDPVGAISVHGVCGVWGTLSVAIFHHAGFSAKQLMTQAGGALLAFVWSFGLVWLLFQALHRTIGLRVNQEDELDGLDLSEHGGEAYPFDLSAQWETEEEPNRPV